MKKQTKPKRKYTKKNSVPVVTVENIEAMEKPQGIVTPVEVAVDKILLSRVEEYEKWIENTPKEYIETMVKRQGSKSRLEDILGSMPPQAVASAFSKSAYSLPLNNVYSPPVDEFQEFTNYNRNRNKQMFQLIVALFWTLPIVFYYLVFGL